MSDNVIPLFQNTPAADLDHGGSDAVWEFCQEYMGDFVGAVEEMDRAGDLEEFRARKQQVEELVRGWPDI